MAKNTSKRKTTNGIQLPPVGKIPPEKKKLPFNGAAVTEKSFSFSFACFDRSHELFNLGGRSENGTVPANWFLDMLDCLKSVSNMSISEQKKSMHDLHPVDWSKSNVSIPKGSEQCEYWQFRINKSKGRIIGILLDGIFYVVWLDPHHNFTDSEGYGTADYYKTPPSLYEMREQELGELQKEIERLQEELREWKELQS